MFCYQESVSKGAPKLCTPEIWNSLIDSPKVANICKRIAALDPSAEDYNDRKQALKKRLPIIIPHAQNFKNGKRVSADATPSGLAMLDVDHVENPKDFLNDIMSRAKALNGDATLNGVLRENGIVLAAITASGKGLRIIGERRAVTGDGLPVMESIEAAQMRMAEVLGIKEYDAVTKDLARASYVVPRDYILWIYEAGLFAEEDRPDLNFPLTLALPPHVENTPSPSGEGRGEASLQYRGIPYVDIVKQLLLATGNADGAIPGERNTVYFSMANYMRYICDFNADLLLQVLPDFGRSMRAGYGGYG